jgi:flagellar motor switch protein FliG
MPLSKKQKAAMMLMSLDPTTASELLRDINPELVRELAVELAYLDASGTASIDQSAEYAKEFCQAIGVKEKFKLKTFLKETLNKTVGTEKSEKIQGEIQSLLQQRDPFIPIKNSNAQTIAMTMQNEHPQAIAVVLSELNPKKSSDVLKILDESLQQNVVARMTAGERISLEAKNRIAEMICEKLASLQSSDTPAAAAMHPEQSLRKVAVILRNLNQDLRDGLLKAIKDKDPDAEEKVLKLMIIWEDIPLITDRSLQIILRDIEANKLALALTKAEDVIINKIKSNISERAAQSLDEEAALMSAPTKEDIKEAREKVLDILRNRNESGELAFIEEE